MHVVVDGLLTNYRLSGKGKLVVLVHGWGDNLDGLRNVERALADKFLVLSLDLPGFGASQPPNNVWGLENYAQFLKALLEKLNLGDLYALVAHSNGGAVAIKALADGQLRPQKLVLLASAGIRTGQSFRRFIYKVIAKTGNVATIWLPERYRRALRKSLYGVAGSDMLVVPHLQETFKKTVAQDIQNDATTISVPTLLIFGESDRAVPLANGFQLHSLIKGSKLEVLAAGHFVQQDQPDQVNKLIEEFLS